MRKEKIFLLIIVLLLVYIIYLNVDISRIEEENQRLERELYPEKNFSLVSAEIASLSVEEFLEKQKTLTITYSELRGLIEGIVEKKEEYYGVYFEDLTTGSWFGINERENNFVPASLLKLPSLVATMKKVEKGEISLADKIKLNRGDIDSRSGTLWRKGENYELTIEELLNYLVKESDNTAANTLKSQVLTMEEIVEAQYAMGLPSPEESSAQKMSPKSYSNMLRSLYLSSYLRRTFSEKALTIMIDTEFNTGIPAKLPKEIKVAHKVGMSQNGGYYPDCGIIYHPKKPYLLCIMSAGSTQEKSDSTISEISKTIYDYITSS